MGTDATSREGRSAWISGLLLPDEHLLRRFGYVRAVGSGAYIAAVLVMFALLGVEVWPLLLGVPVLIVVTAAYFLRSLDAPRTSVVVSLLADALVFGGAIAYIGGSGSGLVSLYAITIVSAGILLGPSAALVFTAISFALSGLQLTFEELGFTPTLLHREALGDRVPILLVSLAVLASIGYLTATYASRLHQLIAEAGVRAQAVQARGARRRSFMDRATKDVQEPLRDVDAVSEILESRWADLGEADRRRVASRLRVAVARLDAEIAQLADVGTLDAAAESRPEPVFLQRVVDDCLMALGDQLHEHVVDVDVPPIKVVGNRRAARRVVLALLENVAEHTPGGTRVQVRALTTAGNGVLVLSDDGPGIPQDVIDRASATGDTGELPAAERVGLPLVFELCESMGVQVRIEEPPGGGTRFLLAFRLAPAAAPTPDDAPGGARGDASGGATA